MKSEGWNEGSEKKDDEQDGLCMILAEEKRRFLDRELQTDLSSATYNLAYHDVNGGEELEVRAIMQVKHQDESGTGERQGSLEKDSLR